MISRELACRDELTKPRAQTFYPLSKYYEKRVFFDSSLDLMISILLSHRNYEIIFSAGKVKHRRVSDITGEICDISSGRERRPSHFFLLLFRLAMALFILASASRSAGRTGALFGHPAQGHLNKKQISQLLLSSKQIGGTKLFVSHGLTWMGWQRPSPAP